MSPLGIMASAVVSGGGSSLTFAFQTSTHSSSDLATYTFSSVSIGTASSDRWVYVSLTLHRGAGAPTVTSVTIGGVAATQDATVSSVKSLAAIYRANVTSGTTADVVVTLSAAASRAAIGVWTSTGGTPTVVDTDAQTGTNPDTVTLTLSTGDFLIVGGYCYTNGSSSITWTNATERYDALPEASSGSYGGADHMATVGGDHTITATWSSATDPVVLAAAAYR